MNHTIRPYTIILVHLKIICLRKLSLVQLVHAIILVRVKIICLRKLSLVQLVDGVDIHLDHSGSSHNQGEFGFLLSS
jgi:hypothetical protein